MSEPSVILGSRVLQASAFSGNASPVPEPGVPPLEIAVVECLGSEAQGLALVGEARGPEPLAPVALRLALDQVRAHLDRHADLLERFRLQPGENQRQRILEVMAESFVLASREVYALGHRREARLGVHLDLLLVLGGEALMAHAGGGCIQLFHEGLLHQLTASRQSGRPLPRSLDEDLGDPPSQHPPALEPLGRHPDPPGTETLAFDLVAGDRVLMIGASLAEVLPARSVRGALPEPSAAGLAAALLTLADPGADRPRAAMVVQVGQDAGGGAAERLAVLRSIDIFRWCTDEELHGLAGLARPRTCRQGELLLRQGRVNPTLFLLVRGKVGVVKDGQRIAETDRGSVFGEMSMLDDPRASATVEALTDVEVLTVDRDAFLHALKRDANLAVKVLWSMLLKVSGNLRRTSERLAGFTANPGGGPPASPYASEDAGDTPPARVGPAPKPR